MVLGHTGHPLLYLLAAAIVISSLALILTERLNFPDPYDKSLLPRKSVAENRTLHLIESEPAIAHSDDSLTQVAALSAESE